MTRASFGRNILAVFDVPHGVLEFLSGVIDSGAVSCQELEELIELSLLGGAEDWHSLVDCATSMRRSCCADEYELAGHDVLTYICMILHGQREDLPSPAEPWLETDRLIAVAKELERDATILSTTHLSEQQTPPGKPTVASQRTGPKRGRQSSTSHYWSNDQADCAETGVVQPSLDSASRSQRAVTTKSKQQCLRPGLSKSDYRSPAPASGWPAFTICHTEAFVAKDQSPYFLTPPSVPENKKLKRPPPGTVSCVPFPPLTESRFGIIQEVLAHEPFWLLIAITFLIKTNGKYAIPVFWKVKDRFPTPEDIGAAPNAGELLGMIRHLGLSANRLAFFQKYARLFLSRPPAAGFAYKVKNYDRRDVCTRSKHDEAAPRGHDQDRIQMHEDTDPDADADAWEIGHMTQGRYAIDSWRIFCRDELLGRASDWNGGGREPEFQPEWMRVLPHDKELRAYLRWMWMRDGWEWDPTTGERTALRPEMQRAVNERRVEYDEMGGLRILDEPRTGS